MGLRMCVPGFLLLLIIGIFELDVVSGYIQPPPRQTLFIPHTDQDSHSTQQVHISQLGQNKMRISWITGSPTPAKVT
ncbi:hypothetical protein glysoja_021510 [Glycine soja]|nr:hypothetical protein glysoja_021510 [Glycine soja]